MRFSISNSIKPVFLALILLAIYIPSAVAETFNVTSTSLDGPGSLLNAIDMANNNPGADIIEFDDGLQVDASTAFPSPDNSIMAIITESLVIDGKGSALIAQQAWVDNSGVVNSPGTKCPERAGWLILAEAQGFLEIGEYNEDNSDIEVTVKNLTIKQFNSVASVNKNASLTLDNFKAFETWNTWKCEGIGLIEALEGASLTIRDSKFELSETWEEYGEAPAISGGSGSGAGDLIIEGSVFGQLSHRDQFAIFWEGKAGSRVNIVSSRFGLSGGILISGEVNETNIVNSIWVNYWGLKPEFGDRIVNAASGDMNIIASSLRWNGNDCKESKGTTLCEDYNIESLIERSGSGKINFKQSAVGFNELDNTAFFYFKTLGDNGTDGFTADEYTWIQPTDEQDADALKTITNQSSLRTALPGFVSPFAWFGSGFDAAFVTPAFPGELIDVIPVGTSLINPIDGSPIKYDVVGNPRVDGNGERDIGALQLALAPNLGIGATGDGYVALGWTEPLHHDGLSILRYEITYFETGSPGSTTITVDQLGKVVTGLTNGTEYNFEVRAVYTGPENGPFSNVATATPYGEIGTPLLTVTARCGSALLEWTQPDLGGRQFTGYYVSWGLEGSETVTGSTLVRDYDTLSTTITGLFCNKRYVFSVSAITTDGLNGGRGTIAAQVPPTPPVPMLDQLGMLLLTLLVLGFGTVGIRRFS